MTRRPRAARLGAAVLATVLLAITVALTAGAADAPFAPGDSRSANADSIAAGEASIETGARCDAHDPLRRPLFGDLHVHTALSFDAAALGVRNLPTDAYRFARGGDLGIQPYDADGVARRQLRLERPLDFAAVTDHAELLGEIGLCQMEGSEAYASLPCRIVRRWPLLAYYLVNSRMLNVVSPERYSFCGEDGERCRLAGSGPWQTIRDAAEQAYDRSAACTFTSFVAYEWSGGPGGFMVHRNVIFADERAPDLPVSFLDESTGEGLWKRLEQECDREGCRFLTIPHNTNLSGGLLFETEGLDRAAVEKRRAFEPLLEIVQHKGDSECRAGAADELCSFEKLPFARMEEQPFPFRWREPAPRTFAREILGEGLRVQADVGLNPFRLGMIGASDTHLGAPGLVDERNHPGHAAGGDTSRVEIPLVPDSLDFNPGGLAGVWAEENSRASIFAALQRREVWSTSGPRIVVRFFGGWDYRQGMCERATLVREGYDGGVAMGGELVADSRAWGPVLVVSAMQDSGTRNSPGAPLDRLQVVKIWLEDGEVREQVVDIAATGEPDDLDPRTCDVPRSGAASLCAEWRDPSFDATKPAIYYARVVEKPTCRWTGHLCAARGVDCATPPSVPGALGFCCDGSTALVVRERAVTSPIWVSPPASIQPR